MKRIPKSPRGEPIDGLTRVIAEILHAQCMSVRQFAAALRSSVVQLEAARCAPAAPNKARIAFSTGLSRSEVARHVSKKRPPLIENDFESIISLWRTDARFLDENDKPKDLPIFGRSKSFEQIVKQRGKGIPIRAILDELVDRGAVWLLPGQMIRLQPSFPRIDPDLYRDLTESLESFLAKRLQLSANSRSTSLSSLPYQKRTHLKRNARRK